MKRAFSFAIVCVIAACRDSLAPTDFSRLAATGRHASIITPSGVEYTPIDLGTLGGPYGTAKAINSRGQIAGAAFVDDTHAHATFWDVDGGIRDLGTLGGNRAFAEALNASGMVTGYSKMADASYHAFVWNGGSLIDLGTLNGDPHSFAQAINDNGVVVGASYSADFALGTPYSWQNGIMTAMGTLGGFDTWPWAINNSGVTVGYSYNTNGEQRAVIWHNGIPTDLGTPAGSMFSEAVGINDAGQVIGFSFTPDGEPHGFRWENGVFTDLGSLGAWGTIPREINALGDIVGSTLSADGQSARGFLWRDGVMKDIGTMPGFQHTDAVSVNDKGQVVGTVWNSDPAAAPPRAFLWENGVMMDLGVLPNANSAGVVGPNSINSRGQIIGGGGTGTLNESHPILWQPDAAMTVVLDIKPGTASNTISPISSGMIPVAILSTNTFDATTVDVATVRFGPADATEAHGRGHVEDANGDGVADLVLHFSVRGSGITCGQQSASLTGSTLTGRLIRGSDAIVAQHCQ